MGRAGEVEGRPWRELLVGPPASLRDHAARQRMRVLASLLLPVIPFGIGAAILADPVMRPVFGASVTVALGAWGLSRGRYHRLAGVCAVVACLVVPYAGLLSEAPTTSAAAELMWLVIAVVVGGLALPLPTLGLVGSVNLVAVYVILESNPGIPTWAAIEVVLYLGLITILVVVYAAVRARNVADIAREQRFAEQIVASMGDGLFVANGAARLERVNPALEAMVGRPAAELVGQPVTTLLADGDPLPKPGPVAEVVLRARGGELRPASLHLAPLGGMAGERDRTVGVVVDLRETLELTAAHAAATAHREHAEELAAAHQALLNAQAQLVQAGKLAALGEMAAGVAHEINNPMAAIMLSAGLLQSNPGLDPEGRRHVVRMLESIERCRGIVDNLLRFGRTSTGERGFVDLGDIAREAAELAGHRFERPDSVQLELPPSLPVHGDPNQLLQVLVNLLLNAADAVDDDGRVAISGAVEHGEVALTVADDGPGVAAEVAERIFDPFFTTKPVGRGTGLGLSVSYGIVQDHGGDLRLTPSAAGGAAFTLTLPAASPPATR